MGFKTCTNPEKTKSHEHELQNTATIDDRQNKKNKNKKKKKHKKKKIKKILQLLITDKK